MVKTLARSIREFKKPAILTPLLVTVEVILECIIPFTIANLVNQMQAGCSMDVIVNYGIQLLVLAVLSLIFGVAAGLHLVYQVGDDERDDALQNYLNRHQKRR